MHIHDYEKLWLGASVLLILFLIASVTYGAVGPGVAMVSDSQPTLDPGGLNDDQRFSQPRVERVGENEYAAYVVARQFGYQPDPIVVPENSTVTFYVTSADVTHGFEIVGTNANTMVIPGEVSKVTVKTDEPQEYGLICNEYCGAGHHTMEGKVNVVSQEAFESRNDGGDGA